MSHQPQNVTHPGRPSPARIIEMASVFYESSTLFAASDLGLFAALADGRSSTATDLADSCDLNARAARLLADGCVAIGLLRKDNERYHNTPEAEAFLVPGRPSDLSQAIRYNRDVYDAWGKLTEFGRTGKPVEKPALHLGDDEARTRAFVHAMHGRAMGIGRAVIPMLEVPENGRILDIGGGSGAYSMLVCQANAGATSTLLDLPGIVAVSSELIDDQGLTDRVTVCPGDYHTTPFPGDQDVVMILGVLHQESPDDIQDILARSYAALQPGGAIYIMDLMTDASRCSPPFSALFAINMALTKENGWVFSDEDMRGWLEGAGFESVQRSELAPPMPHWMLSAVKPG